VHAGAPAAPVYEFAYEPAWPPSLWAGAWTALVTAGAAAGLLLAGRGLPDRPALSVRTVAFGTAVLLAGFLVGFGSSLLRGLLNADAWAPAVAWGASWALLGGLLCRLAAPRLAAGRVVLCSVLSGALGFLVFQAADEFVAGPAVKLW